MSRVCAAGKKNNLVGICRIVIRESKAAFSSRQLILVLVRLPAQHILGVGNDAVIDVHHKVAIYLDSLIMRVLKDHSIPVCFLRIGKNNSRSEEHTSEL